MIVQRASGMSAFQINALQGAPRRPRHAGIGIARLANCQIDNRITFGTEHEIYLRHLQSSERQILQHALDKALPGAGWRVGTDRSIRPPQANNLACEVRSGIMCGRPGADQIFTAFTAIKQYGSRVNKTCATHVHVGCAGRRWKLAEMKRLMTNFVQLEGAFNMLVPPSRRDSKYCQSIRTHLGGTQQAMEAIESCTSLKQLVDLVNPSKYFKVNLKPLFKEATQPGTIEFRQPPGSQNPAKITGFVMMYVKFVELSCLHQQRVHVPQGALPVDEFKALSTFLATEVELHHHFLPRRQKQVAKRCP